ncbi:MAG: ribosome-associated translation inhibitor RaiA [Candidatus Pacebacteria bacterium]|jgi:ribosomal subunit interface protein|nr:ribosome-associated translation inhibitor RaiA [Candidatus Paceibacterota bacterium]
MQINIQCKNIDNVEKVREYVEKKGTSLEKLITNIEANGGEARANFEVSRSTNHHKGGEVFHADCHIRIDGKEFYTSSDEQDAFTAIDAVKESLFQEISKNKDRKQTLFKRGASSVKKMMKGLSKRNPFTSKY